jgi:lactate dehydrogenase-like 2-hydroxyacid dehydrogenase
MICLSSNILPDLLQISTFIVGTMSVGFDHLDLEALKSKGIQVKIIRLKKILRTNPYKVQ